MSSNELNFKTNILLKNLVGKDLINDDNIAIVELVKNSYDAEAKLVTILFSKFNGLSSSVNSKIIISDNGIGMDEIDIRDKWLNIAYSEKAIHQYDKGAYKAGNKGIGRFSCDRLGKRLDLITRKNNSRIIHLRLDWELFEVEGDKDFTIQSVPITLNFINEQKAHEVLEGGRIGERGTALVISDLRSIWSRKQLADLKFSLEKFINPNQLFQSEAFKIILSVPSYAQIDQGKPYERKINGEIHNRIFTNLKFNTSYIESSISEDGSYIDTSLFHEGKCIYKLREKNDQFVLLANIKIVIYYLNPFKKAYFMRQTGIRLVDFGSIFLFLNGFRVAPYGDRGDDWLKLDVRRAQGHARFLGSRDIVGRIEIFGTEENFKPISSREGLKNTPAFKQLRLDYYFDIHRKLEKFVVEGLNWDSVPDNIRKELSIGDGLDWGSTSEEYIESSDVKDQRIALSILNFMGLNSKRVINFWFEPQLLEGIIEHRQEEVQALLDKIEGFEFNTVDVNLKKSIREFRRLLKEQETAARDAKAQVAELKTQVELSNKKLAKLRKDVKTYQAQTLFYKEVVSADVGQLMTYHHQINHDTIIVGNYLTRLLKQLSSSENKNSLDLIDKIMFINNRIGALAQYASKANFRSGIKKVVTDIPAYIEQYVKNVASGFSATGIRLNVLNNLEESFEVKVSRVELAMLVDNIIINSRKAHAKEIRIGFKQVTSNRLIIEFIDDGRGLSEDIPSLESIFEMGITSTNGSGLGLYHARRIVENFNGKITAVNLDGGFKIIIEVPR